MQRLCPIILALVLAGCDGANNQRATLTLATTTSTRDSGLLDVLVPMFEQQTGIEVKVVAVGSGQALELGRRGDADVLLTHAPAAEAEFMSDGFGHERHPVMYNDFVLVGPDSDPAKIGGETSVTEALRRIAARRSPFVSRGDDSGTHMKERAIWKQVGLDPHPQADWYVQAGAGMAAVLRMASQKGAYTLSDRATFLAQGKGSGLTIVSQGDPLLQNQYSVIVVDAQPPRHSQRAAARRFAEFLLSREARRAIGRFGVEPFGQPLFFVGTADSPPAE